MPSSSGGQHQPPAERADRDLTTRAAAGDQGACRTLVDRHLGPLVRYAARLLGDDAEAEDVAQETFLRLWRSLGEARAEPRSPAEPRSLAAWLFRVAHNLSIDRLRRRRTVPLDDLAEPVDDRPNAAQALMERERQAAVEAAMASLPERQRAALLLCHYEGLSQAEAASVLETGIEAVESLLARGRRGLRQRLMAAPDCGGIR